MSKTILGPNQQLQLEPFQYPIFYEILEAQIANNWTPQEIGVGQDVLVYKTLQQSNDPTDKSMLHWFSRVLAQLTTFDILRAEDATTLLLHLIEPEEIRQFLIRLQWEEVNHTLAYKYIIQNFGIPETGLDSIYELWQYVPELIARVDFANKETLPLRKLLEAKWQGNDWRDNRIALQSLLRALIFWFLIFEKVWFLVNLQGPIQWFAKQRKFVAAAEQFTYIARDEVQHVRGGVELIRAFVREHPETITDEFLESIQKMYEDALDLEHGFVNYCSRTHPIMGYSVADHIETAKVFANLGARASGFIPDPFPDARHRFPWMSETETKQERNFFETRVIEYQAGADLGWEEGETWDDGMFDHLNPNL